MATRPTRPIPAATFGRNFGLYREQAIADGVVEISNNGRPAGAYLSQTEYEKFKHTQRSQSAVVCNKDPINPDVE